MSLFFNRIFSVTSGVALVLAVSACSSEQQAQSAPPPPEVVVAEIEQRPLELSSTLPGRTTAAQVAEVRPQVSGIIKERLFEEGDDVKAGQALYQIDSAPYVAAVASAQAALSRAQGLAVAAENRRKRFSTLVESKAVSRQNYDDAVAAANQTKADVDATRAALKSAQIELDRTTITASIDGKIGRSFVTTGALVTAGQPQELATINSLDPIYVDITQSSAELLRWKRMQQNGELQTDGNANLSVSLTLEDDSAYEHKGKIALTEVSVDPSTGSVTLRAVFPNPDNLLLPGMFVRARVSEGVRKDAVLVTQKAVNRNPKGEGIVYLVDKDNKTEPRMIRTERAVGDQWLVTDGLADGERIVIEGFQRFRPGDTITPVDITYTAEAAPSTAANSSSKGMN